MRRKCYFKSPIGVLCLEEEGNCIVGIYPGTEGVEDSVSETVLLKQAKQQLQEYFDGIRTEFTLPLKPAGTDFQRKVWKALQLIPYGETRSYKEIACQIGSPGAARAVGSANNKNPILILIPCHRVVGTDGKMVGFAWGLDAKEYLLNLEKCKNGKGIE